MEPKEFSDSEFITVDEETLRKIDSGIQSGENGRRWTLDEALQYAKNRRKLWRKIQTDQSALSF